MLFAGSIRRVIAVVSVQVTHQRLSLQPQGLKNNLLEEGFGFQSQFYERDTSPTTILSSSKQDKDLVTPCYRIV